MARTCATARPTWRAPSRQARKSLLVRTCTSCCTTCFCTPSPTRTLDAARWDAACDIAVEAVITQLALPATASPRAARQTAALAQLQAECPQLTAEALYRAISPTREWDNQQLAQLAAPFVADDHEPWHRMAAEEAARRSGLETGEKQENAADSPAPAAGEAGKNGTDMPMPDEARKAKPNHKAHRGLSLDDITEKEAPEKARGVQANRFADTVNARSLARPVGRTRRLRWACSLTPMQAVGRGRVEPFHEPALGHAPPAGLHRFLAQVRAHGRARARQRRRVRLRLLLLRPFALRQPAARSSLWNTSRRRRIRDFVIAIDTSASTKDGLVSALP